MSSTAMKEAFKRAGVKSPTERLHDITLKAMIEHADNTFATCDAIWAVVQKDTTLMATLFQYSWRTEVSALMRRVRSNIAYHQEHGTLARPIEREAAKVIEMIKREELREREEHAAHEAISTAKYKAEQERKAQKWLAKWHASRVGNIVINDQPIWENTVGTVRGWLVLQKKKLATVEALIAGLPDDGRPISYYRKPEEIEELWQRAEAAQIGGK